eukprot:TRINITY_DN57732_c0_g1_i1.p1 TRINITY_DN57732_c0_g1~~TRINITY_DN57732_c0_g1_i1.p1  ORF type:complete len:631 (-),score=49.17 TRINITY_DN57732_c0_g1_i1:173-1996(-)
MSEAWVPVSGSWIWWYGKYLMILCEDASSTLFSDARKVFTTTTGADASEVEYKGDVTERYWPELFADLSNANFPDVYYASVHIWKRHVVIGLGRRLEHRTRAACVGFAMLHAGRAYRWVEPKWRSVCNEVFWYSASFPVGFFKGFAETEGEVFWQNVQQWQSHPNHACKVPLSAGEFVQIPPLGAKAIEDIVMNCQHALHAELDRGGDYAEIDLTMSQRPWCRIVTAHKKWRELVGCGVTRFAVAVHRDKISPYQERPLVHFVIERTDGSIATFSDSHRSEADLRSTCLAQDRRLAFRLAAGWEVRGRWEAFKWRVCVDMVDEFEQKRRPAGWLESDFRFQCDGSHDFFAWALSADLKEEFLTWLVHDRQECVAISKLRDTVRNDPVLLEAVDSSVSMLRGDCADTSTPMQTDRIVAPQRVDDVAPRLYDTATQQLASPTLFTPLQRAMFDDCFRDEKYRCLDPSRDASAEHAYAHLCEWFEAANDKVRFSHDAISSVFLHGDHNNSRVDSLVTDLLHEKVYAQHLPPLVCIKYEDAYRVIFGNRRLYAYKEAARRGVDVWFRMIVHEFPSCQHIRDRRLRVAFRLKAIQAMDTTSDGKTVTLRSRN